MSGNKAKTVPNPNAWPEQLDSVPKPYIITNDDRNKNDGPIHDLDVVRPINKVCTTRFVDECQTWLSVSTQCCPTYGNCVTCFRSGPAGMECVHCKMRGSWYVTRFLLKNVLGRGEQYIDAQWFAHMLNLDGNVIVMANRKAWFLTSPVRSIDEHKLEEACNNLMPENKYWYQSMESRKNAVRKIFLEIMIELQSRWNERPSEVDCPPITDNRSVLDE